MKYVVLHESIWILNEENFRSLLKKLAKGETFFLEDFGKNITGETFCGKTIDITKMTRNEAIDLL